MIRVRTIGIALLIFAPTFLAHAICQESHAGIPWQVNSVEARKEAKRKKRLLMVFVYEPVSYWSDRMETSTFPDPRVRKMLSERFVLLKLLSVKNGDLLKEHNIDRFPTIFFESPLGKVLGTRHVGYVDADKMLEILTKIQDIANKSSAKK